MTNKFTHYFQSKLHWQIILPLLVFLLISGISGSYVLRLIVKNNLKTEFLQRGELAAHTTQYAIETSSTIGGIQRYVAALGAENDFDFVIVIAGNPARVIASTERVLIGQNMAQLPGVYDSNFLATAINSRSSQHDFSHTAEHLTYTAPILISNIVSQGHPLGKGALLMKMRTESLTTAVANTLITLTTLMAILLVSLALLLILLVRRYVLRPQKYLLSTVTARHQGEKVMTPIEGKNEFAQLGEAFNEMLRANDSLDKLKSEFISTVSHELRTPLTSISGSIKLILGKMSDEIPEKAQRLLDIANSNVERLTLLINDILDLEKLTSSNQNNTFQTIDLTELTYKAIESNKGLALEKNIQLCFTEYIDNTKISGDADRLHQVFSNFLSNAIKYSPEDNDVEISIKQSDKNFRVTVKDYGSGIPESFRTRIFERFAQADSSDTREKGGTGLGLNISKTIIESHNGTIGYETEIDVGAEFYFELPALV